MTGAAPSAPVGPSGSAGGAPPAGLDKRTASLTVLVPGALLLLSTTQTWVTGRADDVLSHGVVEVTGAAASPGVLGLGIVCLAALLGTLTGGRVTRRVSAGVLVLASVGALGLVLGVVLRPSDTVAAAVARELARTTPPAAAGSVAALGWLATVAAALLVAGAVLTARAGPRWAGLSGRYDRAGGRSGDPRRADAGPRGEVRSTWDELTEGRDPTAGDATADRSSEPSPDSSEQTGMAPQDGDPTLRHGPDQT